MQSTWHMEYIPHMPGRDEIPDGGLFLSGVANPIAWLATLPAADFAAWRGLRGGGVDR